MSDRHPKPRKRPHTAPEILHAVARMLTSPRPGGIGLAVPEEIRRLFGRGPDKPARLILPSRTNAEHLYRWAVALERIDSITATASAAGDGDMNIVVVGRIPRGPVITIESWVRDFPLSLIPDDQCAMTLDELHALNEGLA